ncbi:MAG: hypothetical protein JXA71_13750 [Chitinispirillaceae bacterium]|nr:hypothetical protein [Chitinispirillaceae bacterium]
MSQCGTEKEPETPSCCCSRNTAPSIRNVSPAWTRADRQGAILCRLSNRFRMRYRVDPGLYAVGSPNASSPLFVSASYRLSFNLLRRALASIDGWVLVLDTKGINVWCAAGKGTFGTAELVGRIASTGLASIVSHRRLIVPQLGAVGVSAHEVRNASGFSVTYGPVRAQDIPAFIAAGNRATPAMRTIRFPLMDRAVLTPMELFPALRKFIWIVLGSFVVLGAHPQGILFVPAFTAALPVCLALFTALVAGTVITPLLLPVIPGRSFAIKGAQTGAIALMPFLWFHDRLFGPGWPLPAAVILFGVVTSSYLALNFTGCTTFTGMSGVKKEMRAAIPLYIGAVAVSSCLVIFHKVLEWELL